MEAIKEYLFKRSLNKKSGRTAAAPVVKDAKSIGIIFNASEIEVRDQITAFGEKLQKEGYQVRLLGYLDQKADSIAFTFDYFTVKDVNFYHVPHNEHIQHFLDLNIDVLMNLDLSNVKALHFVAAASKATFKVGPSFVSDHYHLMIETNKEPALKYFIAEMRNTLNKIE